MSPRPSWTLRNLLREIDPNLESRVTPSMNSNPRSTVNCNNTSFGQGRQKTNRGKGDRGPDWARAASLSGPLRNTPQIPSPNIPVGMDLDEIPSVPAMDPRDELREQLLAYLQSGLPQIIKSTIELYRRPQEVSLRKTETSSDSIHARPSYASRNSSSLARVSRPLLQLPLPKEYEEWSLSQSIKFLSEWRPIPQGTLPTKKPTPFSAYEKGSLLSLANFVQPDRRRGREFARGDWNRACEGLKFLFPDVQCLFEKAVKEAFDSLFTP